MLLVPGFWSIRLLAVIVCVTVVVIVVVDTGVLVVAIMAPMWVYKKTYNIVSNKVPKESRCQQAGILPLLVRARGV